MPSTNEQSCQDVRGTLHDITNRHNLRQWLCGFGILEVPYFVFLLVKDIAERRFVPLRIERGAFHQVAGDFFRGQPGAVNVHAWTEDVHLVEDAFVWTEQHCDESSGFSHSTWREEDSVASWCLWK